MTDVFTPEKRSYIMSRIRSKNTQIDRIMDGVLASLRYGYEMYPKMFGSPDFIIPRKRIAIFCDGDFWHGYRYGEGRFPKKKFWRNKIEGNMMRDVYVSRRLRHEGWSVLRFWEHDIHGRLEACEKKIRKKALKRHNSYKL